MNKVPDKIHVTYFQRRPRKGFSFSLEYIFNDVRNRLKDKINAKIKICRFYNTGYASKLYNILEAAFRQNKTINHITGEVHFLTLLMKKKTVLLTILDCGMVHRKSGISRKIVKLIYLTWPIKCSQYVTCITEITRQEVIEFANCSPDKIAVVPVAVNPNYKPYAKSFDANNPNILQIGTGYNKNLSRLIQAVEGMTCMVTIIGHLSKEQVIELEERQINYRNFYNLSDDEMIEKYKECDILAFVSTFEGFGMPIIEANAVERVVITSNISSLPEVAGNAACLVDPYNVLEIRKGITRLIGDPVYRKTLIENGRVNKLRFEPQKIANMYFDLYKQINNNINNKG